MAKNFFGKILKETLRMINLIVMKLDWKKSLIHASTQRKNTEELREIYQPAKIE
jgi:hypothetical protein